MKKEIGWTVRHIPASLVIGGTAIYALIFPSIENSRYSEIDRIFLFGIPWASAIVCLSLLLPKIDQARLNLSIPVQILVLILSALSALTFSLPWEGTSIAYSVCVFIALTAVFFSLGIQPAKALQHALESGQAPRIFTAWGMSTIISLSASGFVDNFYQTPLEMSFITLMSLILFGTFFYFLIPRLTAHLKNNLFDFLLHLGLLLIPLLFANRFFQFGTAAPELLIRPYFLPEKQTVTLIGGISLLFVPWLALIIDKLKSSNFSQTIKRTRVYQFAQDHATGLSLGVVFFLLYLMIATVLNHPLLDVDDVFFDADGLNWRLRLTTDHWQDYYQRSVHPFILLILKPPVELLSILLKGDRLFGAYMVVALGGAACVFLTWKIIYHVTRHSSYAGLFASILGFSASHLIFGSMIESYIFLASGLLLFFLFLLEEKPLSYLVGASLPIIGITHSNFAQTALAFFTLKPDIKLLARYITLVLLALVQLSLINNLLFPNAHPFFFVPSTLQAEQGNIYPLDALRLQAFARGFVFSNVVAPTPILHTGEIPFTQFRFFRPEAGKLSEYETPLQTFSAWFWLALILLGAWIHTIKYKTYKTNRLSLALIATVLLNIGIHLQYGKELFLYSANWTYAVVLLLALALQGISKQRWLQITLLAFLFVLMNNNGWLFDTFFYILTE